MPSRASKDAAYKAIGKPKYMAAPVEVPTPKVPVAKVKNPTAVAAIAGGRAFGQARSSAARARRTTGKGRRII